MQKYLINYSDLSLEDRCNAIEWAKSQARDEAIADNASCGGVEQWSANYKNWLTRIIEPAREADEIDDEIEAWWKSGQSNDPRFLAYQKSWRDYQVDAMNDAIDVASDIAREMLTSGETVHDTFEHVKRVMHPKYFEKHGYAIAVFKTPHGKLYSRSFNPNVIESKHVQSDEVVWESVHIEVSGNEADQVYINENEALTALLDDCPNEYLEIASHAND